MRDLILDPIKTVNNLGIYSRRRGLETWIPKYAVFAPDGRMLEEFRRLASAEKWCRGTKDFIRNELTGVGR